MKEIRILASDELDVKARSTHHLFACDESHIRCNTLPDLKHALAVSGLGIILAIPDTQYHVGLRGWTKVQILASLDRENKIHGVMPLSAIAMKQELGLDGWGQVSQTGQLFWDKKEVIPPENSTPAPRIEIAITSNLEDIAMMAKAKSQIENSNCWMDPAGCIFVKNGEILVSGFSTNLRENICQQIPLNFKELPPLNPGERMLFCDSQHAERAGIAQAAKTGIPLSGSTLYVSKFPCRDCTMSVIQSGVTTVIFEKDSYGLAEAELFTSNNITLKKVLLPD